MAKSHEAKREKKKAPAVKSKGKDMIKELMKDHKKEGMDHKKEGKLMGKFGKICK